MRLFRAVGQAQLSERIRAPHPHWTQARRTLSLTAMTQAPTKFLERAGGPRLAYRQHVGRGPTIIFLPGYASDMAGGKASAVFDWAVAHGHGCILFDYAGCGASGGDFADQTIDSWLGDVMDIVTALAGDAPILPIGSSMGGWLMLLLARAMPGRVAALIGIAAAPDFTRWGFDAEEKAVLARDGRLLQPNPYGPEPTLTTHNFWQSGEAHLLLDAPIGLDMPLSLLHGMADADVPWENALRLIHAYGSASVRLHLIKDGDHRLSRDTDIALLLREIAALLMEVRC